ncbi:MAG TPA: glycosyltransferase [Candidatus Binatia bacterium]|nr:glycosyltransferase [Candidatus Binatia bacterium]
MKLSELKIAIVCDWLTDFGGAERVVVELHRLFPKAPIYTSQYTPAAIPDLKDADVRTSWLQHLPKGFKKFLPIARAWSFSRLDLSGYDLVISSTGAEAKAVKTGPKTVHVCYCHSPTQYYWNRYEQYLKNPGFPGGFNWLGRFGLKLLVGPLRAWDHRVAQKPDLMIANSAHSQSMIKRYYQRDSVVVAPPVDTARFKPKAETQKRHGFVTAGRQTPYKRIDLAVAACSKLGLPLTVIGNGPEHNKLVRLAGATVEFKTDVSDSQMPGYFQSAEAFIFPSNVEDFGITAVEALAAGTPVIAFDQGGPKDYIEPGKTGEFFTEQSADSLASVLKQFKPGDYDHKVIERSAEQFSISKFRTSVETVLQEAIESKLIS